MKKANLAALAVVFSAVVAGPALADGDAEQGAKVFNRCKACHSVEKGGPNKVGPNLYGVIGRTAGTHEGFKYSDAMIEAGKGGLVWNEEALDEYLAKPRDFVPKNKMAFAGLRKEDQREDVIAYLKEHGE